MGFAQGFQIGSNIATSRKASRRQDRQQQLTALQQGYEFNEETEQYQPSQQLQQKQQLQQTGVEAQLQAANQQIQQIQAVNMASSSDAMVKAITEGDHQHANKLLKNNPVLLEKLQQHKGTFKGITSIEPVDLYNDTKVPVDYGEFKGTLPIIYNLDDTGRDAINKTFVKIRDAEGNSKIVKVQDIANQTDYYSRSSKSEQARLKENNKQVNAVLEQMGLRPAASRLQAEQADIAETTGDQKAQFFRDNPTATEGDWTAQSGTGVGGVSGATIKQQKALFDLNEDMNERTVRDFVESDKPAFTKMILTGDSNMKVGDKALYQVASSYQGKKKMDATRKSRFLGTATSNEAFLNLYKRMSSKDYDRDAVEKLNTIAQKTFGIDILGKVTEDNKKAVLEKIKTESEAKAAITNLLRAMSGLTVTEFEYDRYLDMVISGDWSTKEAALSSMEGLVSANVRQSNSELRQIAEEFPRTALDFSSSNREVNELYGKTFDSNPAAEFSKPSNPAAAFSK